VQAINAHLPRVITSQRLHTATLPPQQGPHERRVPPVIAANPLPSDAVQPGALH